MSLTVDIPIGLYVHLPWCIRKCPYCDFNSHEATGELPYSRYVDSLLLDLDAELEYLDGRKLGTIFIGGGTPSLFPAASIARLLDGIRRRVVCADDMEITLEANPGAADTARFADFRAAGVNRLSVGVQSFRNHQLQRLGRVHNSASARAAVAAARTAGFENINIDLMHGLPDDGPGDSLTDLHEALAFEPEHLSWYQLTIEVGTAFANKPPELPDADAIANEFDAGRQLLLDVGYDQYEISAYSRPGHRARHNLNYWEFGDYIGIGAGAHGKLTSRDGVFRTEKRRSPAAYMSQAGEPACTVQSGPITANQLVTEFALNVLRLRHGFTERLFAARTGLTPTAIAKPLQQAQERGWIVYEAGTFRPSELGYRFLNDLQLLFLS